MDRSNYPTRVEVRRGDLTYTESSKIFHILQRCVDFSQPGIVQGLAVTQSSSGLSRYDIMAGFGYAPNGTLVELHATLSAQPVTASDPVLIGLMYREIETKDGAALTDGVARPRQVIRSAELKTFTAAAWEALPSTFDVDLSVDAQDRFLICAIAALPANDADPLDLVVPPTFDLIKTIPQPSIATGIVITGVSPVTRDSDPFPATGTPSNAQLIYDPTSFKIAYKAPFDTTPLSQAAPFAAAGVGAPQILGFGAFTLVSANNVDTLDIVVDATLLPSLTAGTVTENLAVTTLYTQVADRASAKDNLHRHQLGSHVPTAANPHGSSWSNLQAALEEVLGTLKVGTAYRTTPAQAEVPRIFFPANPTVDATLAGTTRRYQLLGEIEGSSHFYGAGLPMRIRVYRTGFDSLSFVLNARVRNTGTLATFERFADNGDNPNQQAAVIDFSPQAVVFQTQDAASSNSWTAWDRVQLFHGFPSNTTALTGSATLGEGLLNSAAQTSTPRVTLRHAQAFTRTELLLSERLPSLLGSQLRIFRSNTGVDGANTDVYEIVFNADWSESPPQWVKDAPAQAAFKVEFFPGGVYFLGRGTAGATFTDTIDVAGWDQPYCGFDNLDSNLFLSAGNYGFTTARTFSQAYGPGDFAIKTNGQIDTFAHISKATPGTSTDVILPLHLPHGATLSSPVTLHGRMTAGGSINQALVVRYKRDAAQTNEDLFSGSYATFADTGGAAADNNLVVDQHLGIDNTLYNYAIFFSSITTASFSLDGAYVTYTLDRLVNS